MRQRQRPHFTLIELLVVIAIIAILVSMLVPALTRGMYSARQVKCISNHRQVVLGCVPYADEWDDFFPNHFVRSLSPSLITGDIYQRLYQRTGWMGVRLGNAGYIQQFLS